MAGTPKSGVLKHFRRNHGRVAKESIQKRIHPAPRRFAYAIIALFLITIAWACFGQVDIVAVDPGRIIEGDRTKVIQPLEASIVRKVLVKDGDRVFAGHVLVELDPTIASADKTSV